MSPSRLCWRPFCVAGLFFVLGVGVLGCNVFEDVQPEPSSVEALLADARIAMTKGNHQRAVRLLEEAFGRDSTHVEVRIELANALYAARGVDAFTVRAAVEHVNGKGADSARDDTTGTVCTDGADPGRSPDQFRAVSFETEALRTLAAQRERIRRISRLVVAGVLQRRADAFSQEPPDVRAKGYFLAALTRGSLYVLDLRKAILDAGATLYVDTGGPSSRAFIACGDSQEAVARVERTLCRGQRDVRKAAFWLQIRNELVGSEQTSLLIDLLGTHASAVQARLSCPASTVSE